MDVNGDGQVTKTEYLRTLERDAVLFDTFTEYIAITVRWVAHCSCPPPTHALHRHLTESTMHVLIHLACDVPSHASFADGTRGVQPGQHREHVSGHGTAWHKLRHGVHAQIGQSPDEQAL